MVSVGTTMKRAVVGDIEIFVPADVLDYEIVRAPDETDEEFATAKVMYDRLFRMAVATR